MAFVTFVVNHWLEQEQAQWVHHELRLTPIEQVKKELFYLTMHSTHFYGYVASDIW